MPIYDYYCVLCDREYSEQKSMDSDTRSMCSVCGTVAIRKYNFGSVSFKGSGFYSTDKKGES